MRQILLLVALPHTVAAASPATGAADVEELVVRSTRIEQTETRVPLAVSVVERDAIQLGRQQLGIDEALNRVPGVFFQNRYNFNQDLRISVRGFGAQAQFGIAGIHLTVDDIPVTTPDGTAQVDDLDMGSMGRIEVVRGPSGALYGTSAGGAINMYTEAPAAEPYLEARAMSGAFGTEKYQLKASGRRGRLGYVASAHYLNADGFRDFAETEATVFNSKLVFDADPTLQISAVAAGVHSPKARDPGALTPAELAEGPRDRARAQNVTCNVDESVDQYRAGVVATKSLGDAHELRVRGYGLTRDFEGRLPCPFVGHTAFDRLFVGGGGEYAWNGALLGRPLRLVTGFELTEQDDDRRGWAADTAGTRGALDEDQHERVSTRSVYLLNEWSLTQRLLVSIGARWQDVEFELDDALLVDGDNSDELSFSELVPMAGVSYAFAPALNLYASVSTAFETPTFAQLGDPTGPGIDASLDAQTSVNYEIGAKGAIGDRLTYGAALFHIDLDDQLVPFEDRGDVFYRNAGESSREGLELAASYAFTPALSASLAYTLNDFRFEEFTAAGVSHDGNDHPGVPKNQLFVELAYAGPSGWYGFVDLLHVGRLYADDANSPAARVDAYQVANARVGRRFRRGHVETNVFVGVNNLLDEDYFSNVRLNQTFDRYFEPAPDRHLFAGVSLRFGGR